MGGVVFAENDGNLSRIGAAINIASGAPIPPGTFFVDGAWNALIDGTPVAMPPGIATSDGSATAAAALQAFPMGAGDEYVWPWPLPWPLSQMPWPP